MTTPHLNFTIRTNRLILTLVDNVEARLVLGVVTVEEESGLVGGAKERVRHHGATEPINHCSCVQAPAAHL